MRLGFLGCRFEVSRVLGFRYRLLLGFRFRNKGLVCFFV